MFGMPENPTARHIFPLRQQFRMQPNREDPTAPIRLVWLPGEDSEEYKSDDFYLEPLPAKAVSLELFVAGNTSESEQEEGEKQGGGEVVVE
jgi:hypothetical protein